MRHLGMWVAGLGVALALGTGCKIGPPGGNDGGEDGAEDGGGTDGGGTDGGGTDGGGAGTVTGSSIDTFIKDEGTATKPRDLSDATIAALVDNGGGAFDTHAGTGLADGTVSIPGVPEGPYYLRFDKTYIVTSARDVDLGTEDQGRIDTVLAATSPTNLVLNVTGLNAWQDSDDLEMFATNANAWYFSPQYYGSNAPAVGNTSLSAFTFDTVDPFDNPLIDGSKGDVALLTQLVTQSGTTGYTLVTLAKKLQFASFTQTDGQTTTLSGAMTDVAQDQNLAVDFKVSQFSAMATAVNPAATVATTPFIFVSSILGGNGHGFYAATADVVYVFPDADDADLNLGTLHFGNPYPSDKWGTSVAARADFGVSYTVTGGSAKTFTGGVQRLEPIDTFNGTLAPSIGSVSNPLISGVDMFTDRTGVGLTPAVSWAAPSLGTPTHYSVQVNRLFADAGKTKAERVATILTTGTSVRIPPGVLETGQSYYLRILSLRIPGMDLAAHPFRRKFPDDNGVVLTNKFAP